MFVDPTLLNQLTLVASAIFSTLAIAVSFLGVYLQFVRTKGPRVVFLSSQHQQRARILPFTLMPPVIQQNFPNLPEPNLGYFVIDLAFANSGDRTAFVWIEEVVGTLQGQTIHVSHYDYSIIPPGSVVLHRVLARNVPQLQTEENINLSVSIQWGGVRRRKYKAEHIERHETSIKLVLSG